MTTATRPPAKPVIRPLTPERWPDLEAVFASRGCALARSCFCMYYRLSGPQPRPPPGRTRAAMHRAALKRLVDAGPPPGLLAYLGGVPAGWVTLGPREAFARLRRSPVLRPVDGRPVWSVVCFVVPAPCRGQGIARSLLDGAIAHARSSGAHVLEAYPVDRAGRSRDDAMWFGAKSMFDDAGFAEVARRRPARPIMWLDLDRFAKP